MKKLVKESLLSEDITSSEADQDNPWYVQQDERRMDAIDKNRLYAEKIKGEIERIFRNKEHVKVSGGLVRSNNPEDNYKNLNIRIPEESILTKTIYIKFNYRGKEMYFALRRFGKDIEFSHGDGSISSVGKKRNFKKVVKETIDWVDGIPQNRL